ncbi:MAG: cysteine desulfurase [Kiritimatiellaceae bacterium]|nr:cysteine desulfurase [Kiritimatiellaceae bacterium]
MIYLDYNATGPMLPEVLNAMCPFFCEQWANPSSPYAFAKQASDAIEIARSHVASLIGAKPNEIVFSSCATESNQTVLHGVRGKVATSTVEHSSIIDFLKERDNTCFVPVDGAGRLDLEALDFSLTQQQIELVSVIWANNEVGVISPIEQTAKICKKHGVLFHSDAVQAAGKIEVDVKTNEVDYLSLSAHKIFGPKGIGALYVRDGAPYRPLLVGRQEKGRRGGTEAVPLIVGFGKAAELAKKDLSARMGHTKKMRDMLENSILQQIPEAYINGDKTCRLPNTTNIGFKGIDSDTFIQFLSTQGIMAANGSACKSSAITPSHVLTAMGRTHEESNEAIRFSLSHLTQENDICSAVSILKTLAESLRG